MSCLIRSNPAGTLAIRGLLLVGDFSTTILTGGYVLRKCSKCSNCANLRREAKVNAIRDANLYRGFFWLFPRGRRSSDTATTLGTGVDGSVLRHNTSYDTGGRPYKLTSYSNTAGTTVVNQVQFGYNGFGQETIEYQDHTSGGVSAGSFNIKYSFVDGTGNSNRLVSMTYPNGRILDYDYSPSQMVVSGISSTTTTATVTTILAHGLSIGDKLVIQGAGSHYDGLVTVASVPSSTTFTYTITSFTGSSSGTDITEAKLSIDEAISRIDGLQDRAGTSAGTILEAYSYLGLDTIVEG